MEFNKVIEVLKQSTYLRHMLLRVVIVVIMTFFFYGMILKYHTHIACKGLLGLYVSNGKLTIDVNPLTNEVSLPMDDRCGDPYKLKVIRINNETTIVIYSINGGSASMRIEE